MNKEAGFNKTVGVNGTRYKGLYSNTNKNVA